MMGAGGFMRFCHGQEEKGGTLEHGGSFGDGA